MTALGLRDGLGRATSAPRLKGGDVTLRPQDAEILGGRAPAALVVRIQNGRTERADADYPLGLRSLLRHHLHRTGRALGDTEPHPLQ
ncbi:hypothetical protein SAMN04487981_105212 [Streptomyces sp. cf386]|nr:hypothetical protein SAMN04487981_105212 [Streptomyces sp. cf386]